MVKVILQTQLFTEMCSLQKELNLKYAEKRDDRCFYRFRSHPQFAYWAFNLIERKHIIKQTGIFL